jgi:hypothetical protein
MNRLFFICGAHTSGKTSILKYLQEKQIIDFNGNEIGKQLYYERKFTTEEQGSEFENEVTELELQRDFAIWNSKYKVPAVETWHLGNLAYAMVRNPEQVASLLLKIKNSPFINDAIGIWLRVSKENIQKRTKTFESNAIWAADFYTKVDSKIELCIQLLNLSSNITVVDTNTNFVEVLQKVEKEIINHLKK